MLFLPHFSIGGTERQVVNLSAGLDRRRFDLHIGCFARRGELLPELETRRIPLTEYKISRLYGLHTLIQQVRFARYLRRHRIDIVHTYNFYANCFAVPAARMAGVPVVVASIRDTGAFLTPTYQRVHRMICRLASVVLVNAAAVRSWLIGEGYRAATLEVIHNGIDLAPFERPRPGAAVRREFGIPEGVPVIAMLGRINRLKGVEYFIDAAAVVAAKFPDARFLIVGAALLMKNGAITPNSAYLVELHERIRHLGLEGRVAFTGFRLDVPELLRAITVSVHPSLSEALSNAVLESMAAALPVVATRVGGTPEIIEDGVTGLLVPPQDSAALAAAIVPILEDPHLAARLGHAAHRRVVEHFSLEQMVRATERLYLARLAQARGRRTLPQLPSDQSYQHRPVEGLGGRLDARRASSWGRRGVDV